MHAKQGEREYLTNSLAVPSNEKLKLARSAKSWPRVVTAGAKILGEAEATVSVKTLIKFAIEPTSAKGTAFSFAQKGRLALTSLTLEAWAR